jgi:RNA polymerase sigma-70 factor (ECF subfamily)
MSPTDQTQSRGSQNGSLSTSRSLLVRLRENDAAAWDRLVELYAPLVFYWCRRLNVPEQDIVDIFQDVFQSVAAHIDGFRNDRAGDTFRGWLRTITRNKVCDHFRRAGRQPAAAAGGTDAYRRLSQFPAAKEFDEDEDVERLQHELFQRALESIRGHFAPQTWDAFWQVVVEGKTPQDVAEALSMRPGAVRVAKSRVLQRLRQELGDLIE